jgi:SSS family solute:Na+ symporter
MQAIVNWLFCIAVCTTVSLVTPPPRPAQVTAELCLDWQHLNIFSGLGDRWYTSVTLWWLLFVIGILAQMVLFAGWFF